MLRGEYLFGCGLAALCPLREKKTLTQRRQAAKENRFRLRYFTAAAAYTGESQPCRSGRVPLITPKNSVCSFSVTGPRCPLPMVMRSMERMGVISAAVPEKKTSSAMYSISRGNRVDRKSTRLNSSHLG